METPTTLEGCVHEIRYDPNAVPKCSVKIIMDPSSRLDGLQLDQAEHILGHGATQEEAGNQALEKLKSLSKQLRRQFTYVR